MRHSRIEFGRAEYDSKVPTEQTEHTEPEFFRVFGVAERRDTEYPAQPNDHGIKSWVKNSETDLQTGSNANGRESSLIRMTVKEPGRGSTFVSPRA